MGHFMARNLANHRAAHLDDQPPLLVWNRSKEKSEKLLSELGERKVAIAQNVVELAKASDIILISISGDHIIKSLYTEIAAALKAQPPTKRKIFVETSTVSCSQIFCFHPNASDNENYQIYPSVAGAQ
jgi:3-hydroxyisobutyrate dehydrogenase-like beta-hydroxyacid dehydrogenase